MRKMGFALVVAACMALPACGGGGTSGSAHLASTPLPTSVSIMAPSTAQSASQTAFGQSIAAPVGLRFNWDFGDGSAASTEAAPTHVFAKPGDYQVRLTVSDASGDSRSASFDIAVNNQAYVKGLLCSGTDYSGWCWSRAMQGSGDPFNNVIFPDADVGWAAGEGGGLYKTIDAGKTWVSKLRVPGERFRSIVFADGSHGWAATASGKLFASTDAGVTWRLQLDQSSESISSIGLQKLHVEDSSRVLLWGGLLASKVSMDGGQNWRSIEQTIFAVSGDGVLWGDRGRSVDFGQSFTPYGPITLSDHWGPESLDEVRPVNGLVAMRQVLRRSGYYSHCTGVAITRDGGRTWTRQDIDPYGPYSSVTTRQYRPSWSQPTEMYASSADSIWALGIASVARSLDGGATWSWLPDGAWTTCYGCFPSFLWGGMVDSAHPDAFGMHVPDDASVAFTANGGETWKLYRLPEGRKISSFQRAGAQGLILQATDKSVFRSDDDGTHWRVLAGLSQAQYASPVDRIEFWDDKQGLALGNQLLMTADGGQTWVVSINAGPGVVTGSYAKPALQLLGDTAWMLSYYAKLLVSTDKGKSWIDQTPRIGSGVLSGMHFFDAMHGIVALKDRKVLSTMDGGATWMALGTLASAFYEGRARMSFSSNLLGLMHDESSLNVTSDGGVTWIASAGPAGVVLTEVKLTDGMKGWAVGYRYASPASGALYETRDGGVTWTERTLPVGTAKLNAIHFRTASLGWIVGDAGAILRTRDAGATWTPQDPGATSRNFTAIHFNSSKTGWLGGSQGEFMATGTGGD